MRELTDQSTGLRRGERSWKIALKDIVILVQRDSDISWLLCTRALQTKKLSPLGPSEAESFGSD